MSEQISTALIWGQEQIDHKSDSPRLDAELLLAHCLGKPRSYLYTWPEQTLSPKTQDLYRSLVLKRIEPTPIAYLLGEREFYSLDFISTAAALVPRAETELLVETVLHLCPEGSAQRILELGTGTGAIAITLKHHRPDITVMATDISPACLALARQNAGRHNVAIEWLLSDWYQSIDVSNSFDIIVSNPPYIAGDDDYLKQGDLPAEPMLALSPGITGLESLEQIIAGAPAFLKPGGHLLLEHGYDQASQVDEIFRLNGLGKSNCKHDMNDLPRISSAQLV